MANNINIIVLEDEDAAVKGLYKLLRLYMPDINFKIFNVAEKAVDSFEAGMFRLAIVDLLLMKSSMQGIDAIKRFRAIDKEIPIIVISGTEYGASQLDTKYNYLEVTSWIKKPIKASKLEKVIRELLK
jgi:two-component SAPR family response regulator